MKKSAIVIAVAAMASGLAMHGAARAAEFSWERAASLTADAYAAARGAAAGAA